MSNFVRNKRQKITDSYVYYYMQKKKKSLKFSLLRSLESVPGIGPLLITPLARIGHCDHAVMSYLLHFKIIS